MPCKASDSAWQKSMALVCFIFSDRLNSWWIFDTHPFLNGCLFFNSWVCKDRQLMRSFLLPFHVHRYGELLPFSEVGLSSVIFVIFLGPALIIIISHTSLLYTTLPPQLGLPLLGNAPNVCRLVIQKLSWSLHLLLGYSSTTIGGKHVWITPPLCFDI